MGNEIGQWNEWKHDQSLDWHLLDWKLHQGMKKLFQDLNNLYKKEVPLHEQSYANEGFEWIDFNDHNNSTLAYIRKDKSGNCIVAVGNFTPTVHRDYRIGVPFDRSCHEIFNSDAEIYGGSNVINPDLHIEDQESHGRPKSINISLPPLGMTIIKGA